jgi:hypothetical protein
MDESQTEMRSKACIHLIDKSTEPARKIWRVVLGKME